LKALETEPLVASIRARLSRFCPLTLPKSPPM
jgi:hypothetical protein